MTLTGLPGHDVHAAPGFVALTGMWLAMMTAMMAPVAWPWILAFQRFGADARARSAGAIVATLSFSSGYLVAWLGYAFVAAALQRALTTSGLVDGHAWSSAVRAGILIGAGAYQFAPLKRACLSHCRNPITYFLTRWRNGPTAGFRLGIGHGVFCVGCCWALMATALAVGMANLWWMAALTAVAFVEQVVPHGDWIRVPLGVALMAGGLFLL